MFSRFVTLLSICTVFAARSTLAAPEGRIVGGDDAELGQLPYQAALSIAGLYTCGAAILNEQYALTALTCVCSQGSDRAWPPQMFQISAGTINMYTGGQHIRLEEITVNPNYNNLETGIALLKLAEPLVFNDFVSAIPLALENPAVGSEIEISGWGLMKETDTEMSRTLQLNNAILISSAECQRLINNNNDQILCLSHPRKNGICRGDIGGPAVFENMLVGMAAYVVNECGSLLPDVFISIAAYHDWIVEQIANSK